MTSWASARRAPTEEEGFVAGKIRALIAEHSATDVDSVTADTHFADDLGYDQIDVLELIIMIENQFGDVELSESDQIEFVGDLIRQIEIIGAQSEKRDGARLCRATDPASASRRE